MTGSPPAPTCSLGALEQIMPDEPTEALDLSCRSRADAVDERTLLQLIRAQPDASRLRTLRLSNVSAVTDAVVAEISGALPSLEALDLEGCLRVTSVGVLHLTRLRGLKALNLSNTAANDRDLQHAISHMPSLAHLSLRGCRDVTDRGVASLSSLRSLRGLSLAGCVRVTDGGLERLLSDTPSGTVSCLRHLDLSGCPKITLCSSRRSLASAFASKRQLTCVRLRGCAGVTDASLLAVCRCPHLEELDLSGCRGLTDVALGILTSTRDSKLRTLKLNNCKKVTDDGIHSLAKLQRLGHVELGWCLRVTHDGLRFLCDCNSKVHIVMRSGNDVSSTPSKLELRAVSGRDVQVA